MHWPHRHVHALFFTGANIHGAIQEKPMKSTFIFRINTPPEKIFQVDLSERQEGHSYVVLKKGNRTHKKWDAALGRYIEAVCKFAGMNKEFYFIEIDLATAWPGCLPQTPHQDGCFMMVRILPCLVNV